MKKKNIIILLGLVMLLLVLIGIYWKYFKIDKEGYTFIDEGQIKYIDTSKTGKIIILPKMVDGIAIEKIEETGINVTKLDATHATELTSLFFPNNNTKILDVSKNTKLEFLDCEDNKLKEIDVTQNPNLIFLHCSVNELEQLDLSNNTNLRRLSCYGNQIKQIDICNNLNLEIVRVDVGTKVIGNHNAEILYYEYNKKEADWVQVK